MTKTGRRCNGLVVLVIGLGICQLALTAWRATIESFVWDEVAHLASGVYHRDTGRFDVYRVNPPLVRLIATAGLPVDPGEAMEREWDGYSTRLHDRPEFVMGRNYVANAGSEAQRLLIHARWRCLWAPLLGSIVIWRWATRLYGRWPGVLALSLWVASPTVLANASLITPDCGAASTGVLALWMYWKWCRNPRLSWLLGAGISLGLALLTKTTWILLFPMMVVLWLVFCYRATPGTSDSRRPSLFGLMAILLLGLYCLNLGYGFEGTGKRLGDFRFVSRSFTGDDYAGGTGTANRFSGTLAGRMPVPLPANFLSGIDLQKSDFERGQESYLCGSWSTQGWWYYYLLAGMVKVPLGILLLGVIGPGFSACSSRGRRQWRDEAFLVLPALCILLVVSSQTGINHHFRYLLPVFPLMFIWISKIAGSGFLGGSVFRTCMVWGLVIWAAVSSLSVYPHSIAYFNELAGGPSRGHLYLVHSNLDWGQDLPSLKKWYDEHPRARPFFFAYSLPLVEPRHYGIEYRLPPASGERDKLVPGWYAVSASALHTSDGRYSYFHDLPVRFQPGYSILIFHLTADDVEAARNSGKPPRR